MDIIKEELMKKKQRLAEESGGRKYFNKTKMEKKRMERVKEEEQQKNKLKTQQNQLTLKTQHKFNTNQNIITQNTIIQNNNATCTKTHTHDHKIDSLDLPKTEVVRRLRLLKQPVTVFGEDDVARLDRLKHVLKTGSFEVDDGDMTEGQTNDFLRDIAELKNRQRSGIVSDRKRKKTEDGGDKDGGGDDGDLSDDGASSGPDHDEDLKRMKAKFEELCDEDKILVFFKRLLNEWKQELNEMSEKDKRTAKGKSIVATFKQCARYLAPLFRFCRKKILPEDIRRALMVVVNCCMKRDYLAAMDQYIKMAIGNAPWPIGVTMVGIHERSAREKIYTNSVAHIMNDETTRKYLQSVKRLMTFCQRRYPAMPSKAVEFNSLANGSDLQSLLAEERSSAGPNGPNQSSEEKLMLMPAPKD